LKIICYHYNDYNREIIKSAQSIFDTDSCSIKKNENADNETATLDYCDGNNYFNFFIGPKTTVQKIFDEIIEAEKMGVNVLDIRHYSK
jgi:hypothetical protein